MALNATKVVSQRLGHANIGITLDTYSHILPGLQEAAAERFDKMLEPKLAEGEDVSKRCGFRYAPRGIRTHDPRFRRPMLLSAEL